MESLCPFVKKENEDSIVANMLRLQQGTENERVRPSVLPFVTGCDPSWHSRPPPSSCPSTAAVLG